MTSTTHKPRVLLTGKIDFAHAEWQALSDIAILEEADSRDRSQFIQDLKGKYNGIFAISRTYSSKLMTGPIDQELISHYPDSLKFICHNGAGYDQIDDVACAKRGPLSDDSYYCSLLMAGIKVSNTPGVVAGATADVGIFLLLGALRNFNRGILELRKGNWKENVVRGDEPEGKVLGILGMGGVGKNMAKKAAALGMKIQYFSPRMLSPEDEKAAGDAKYVPFETLLATSDVLSFNLRLNKETRHIISFTEFEKMKDGVVIVNTARGSVMNESALVEALGSGKVRSAGLDVYEDEPHPHPGLLENENVLLLPHMGTHTRETHKTMEIMVINNIRSAITEGHLINPVN